MTESAIVVICLCAIAFQFLIGAVGAWVWTKAAREAVNLRANRNQVATEEFIAEQAEDAIEDAVPAERRPRLTDAEIALAQMYESRGGMNGKTEEEYATTTRNEGAEEQHGPDGGMYRP